MADHHEGQRVSRRRLIAGITSIGFGGVLAACTGAGGGGATATSAPSFASAGTCRLTTSATEGPYYFDADKIRSDIREDRQGKRLRLAIKVADTERCAPIPNAVVEIWHCDAAGSYSGVAAQSTSDQRYLRGAQVTNSDGVVEFTTIWPGWYPGRTVHIHAMVHLNDKRVLTTQLMFDEALNSKVLAEAPYAAHTGRRTVNTGDSIFRADMLLTVTPESDGYLGVVVFGVDT